MLRKGRVSHLFSNTLYNKIPQILSGILTLNVQESPSIVMEPSGSVQLNVGDELRLECNARGDPTPTVVWEKIGQYSQTQSLSTKKLSAVHLVRQLTKDDEGTYLCRAR